MIRSDSSVVQYNTIARIAKSSVSALVFADSKPNKEVYIVAARRLFSEHAQLHAEASATIVRWEFCKYELLICHFCEEGPLNLQSGGCLGGLKQQLPVSQTYQLHLKVVFSNNQSVQQLFSTYCG